MSLNPKNGTYGSHPRFNVGDHVNIDGNKHTIDAIWNGCINSPTGVRLTVSPATRHGRWIESVWVKAWVDDGLDFDEPDGLDDFEVGDGLDF